MKEFVSRLILLLALLLTSELTARSMTIPLNQPPGISFFKGSWKAVLAEAKRQNKPIFLDVYTTWCPPCKRMEKEAFPNPNVGAKYNAYFLNYQLDAERGEGVAIARQYLVASYPTALFIAPDGALIHRAVGYGGVAAMIAQVDHALSLPRLKATIAKGDKDFAEGRHDPHFLKKYLQTRQTLNRPINDVIDAYIDALPEQERTTPETITFIAATLQSSDAKAFDYLIRHRPPHSSADPAQENLRNTMSNALHRMISNDFKQAVALSNEELLEKVIANSERMTASANPSIVRHDTLKEEAANEYRLRFFRETKNFAKYQALAAPIAQHQLMSQSVASLSKADSAASAELTYLTVFRADSLKETLDYSVAEMPIKDHLMSWRVAYLLDEIAGTYDELGTSSADWEAALAWSERSIALYPTPSYAATRARLLKKLGRSN
ncbi:thioredoxin family protein [Spirosoma aerophilum]